MARSRRRILLVAAAVAIAAVVILAAGGMLAADGPDRAPADEATTSPTPALADGERATVAIVAPDGSLRGTLDVRLATTARERYVGLSDTATLGPDEGMLFVHDDVGPHAYVMRDMAFPIDIVFVGADRRITVIHHAPVEEPPLERYRGRGTWVIETPLHWTTDHGVAVGDRVRVRAVSG